MFIESTLVGGQVTGPRTTMEWGQSGLGSFEPDFHKYFRYDDPRRKAERPTLPEKDRLRKEKGITPKGKTQTVNGRPREPQPSVGGGGREPKR